MTAKIIIKKMKDAFKVERDYELAEKLGVEPGTVSGWKKRSGGVPLEYVKFTKDETGVDVGTPLNIGLLKEGPQMSEKLLTEMFLQVRGQMDKFDTKLDELAKNYKQLNKEISSLKKDMGECRFSAGKSLDSRSQTGT